MKIAHFLFPESRDPAADGRIIQETLAEAIRVEELGADTIFLSEHHFDGICAYVDPPVFASAIATATKRIKIGFAVLQTSLYHPLRLAEQLALLDHLSKGRLVVGLGRGSLVNTHEYAGFEIDPNEAQARFEEIEEIMIRCWTQSRSGKRIVHNGRFWNFDIPALRPLTFTEPHPKILRSVASEASLTALGRRGMPFLLAPFDAAKTATMIGLYRRVMAEAGFDEAAIADALRHSWILRTVFVADTEEKSSEGLPYFLQAQLYREQYSENYRTRIQPSGELPPRHVFAFGSPDTILNELTPLRELGVGGLLVRFRVGPMPAKLCMNSIELFMNNIAPQLKDVAAP